MHRQTKLDVRLGGFPPAGGIWTVYPDDFTPMLPLDLTIE